MQGNEMLMPEGPNGSSTEHMQPMSFSQILDGMFSIYRNHFSLFFRITVVYFFIYYAIDKVTMLLIADSLSSGSVGAMFFTLTATTLLAILVGGALAYTSAQVFLGKSITAGDAYQMAVQKYFPLFVCYLFYIFICTILGVTCIGLPFSIYLMVRWGQYSLPILIEDKPVMGALRRSSELVRGVWWRVCGIMLAIIVIYFMIQSILINSFGIVFFLLTGMSASQASGILETIQRVFMPTPLDIGWQLYLLRSFVTIAIEAITLPILTIGSTLLYFDLRIRKDAYDLEVQATQQDAETSNHTQQE